MLYFHVLVLQLFPILKFKTLLIFRRDQNGNKAYICMYFIVHNLCKNKYFLYF